jgi:hypothetical protein
MNLGGKLSVMGKHSSSITFEDWLTKHWNRLGPLGDISRDIMLDMRDGCWPTGAGIAGYRAHIQKSTSSEQILELLNKAWTSYCSYLRRKGMATV